MVHCPRKSAFHNAPDIQPIDLPPQVPVSDFLDMAGRTCFEARVMARGARLWKRMIDDGDCIWLGIAGAGIAGGLGGAVTGLLKRNFIDVICTTGAQAYHDLHFAFDLPVKAISPEADDDALRKSGDTRIHDIGIRDLETLEAQDAILRRFVRDNLDVLQQQPMHSARFNKLMGEWVARKAPHPERSFMVAAAEADVPVFWDSHTNHSIALNLARLEQEGLKLPWSPADDILLSAAIVYGTGETGFVELGGGGPKNFIQQTGPTLSQIFGIQYPGASRGLQISTANVREGSLSSCTFGEAVTWGKYEADDQDKLVQIWGEYSLLFLLLTAYVQDRCRPREAKRVYAQLEDLRRKAEEAPRTAPKPEWKDGELGMKPA
jgi:deoxyhypusine synthase